MGARGRLDVSSRVWPVMSVEEWRLELFRGMVGGRFRIPIGVWELLLDPMRLGSSMAPAASIKGNEGNSCDPLNAALLSAS